MTLTRPAYRAIIGNLDNVWSDTVTAGDTYNPADGVWLADGLKMEWRFSEAPPAQLEPEVVQFAILAEGIDQLPRFDLGDRVSVVLERPTLTDPITYMDFAGRVTDLDLVTDAKGGRVLLAVTAADPTSELSHDVDTTGGSLQNDPVYFSWGGQNIWRYAIAAYYLEIVGSTGGPFPEALWRWWDSPTVSPPKGTIGAAEYVSKVLPPTLLAPSGFDSMAVQRYVVDELTGPEWYLMVPSGELVTIWKYFLAQWRPQPTSGTLPTLFAYAWDPADADRVTLDRIDVDLPADPAVIPLDACYMPDGAKWVKDRTAAPNQVQVTGTRWIDAQNIVEASPGVAKDGSAIERFGAITRTVDTFTAHTSVQALAEKYLGIAPTNAPDSWLFNETTILTETMDDATLDTYAPLFWTVREPVPGVMGMPVLVYGVDPDIDPTNGYMFAHLAGVTFEASDGKLTIKPELTPANAPSLGDLDSATPSYDDFGASAFGAAAYHDQGGSADYIDPTITNDDAKLAAL
jgi:hypothetical protein